LIEEQRLTQTEVARLIGITQPHVSDLENYKVSRFSSGRFVRFLTLLDREIDIPRS
jgi:predicted XRE-type DNA-binding protein